MKEKKTQNRKNIMIGTPTYDGKIDVNYVDSLMHTILNGFAKGYDVFPVFLAYDALIQRARNDLFEIAYSSQVDYLFFIDSDTGWTVNMFYNLLEYQEHVIGLPVRKKTDCSEMYNVKIKEGNTKLKLENNGLIEVGGVGTGFLKIDKYAIKKIWENSEEYLENNKVKKVVFDIEIKDKTFYSEDIFFCKKWLSLNEKVYINPSFTCSHTGIKTFYGNFLNFIKVNNLLEN